MPSRTHPAARVLGADRRSEPLLHQHLQDLPLERSAVPARGWPRKGHPLRVFRPTRIRPANGAPAPGLLPWHLGSTDATADASPGLAQTDDGRTIPDAPILVTE